VNPSEAAFAVVLIVVLLSLAGYFAWRQIHTLRGLRAQEGLPDDDRRYVRRQAIRRLVCSVLMIAFAAFLVGSFFLEPHVQEVARHARERAEGPQPQPVPGFVNFFALYWGAALFVLFVILLLAAADVWAVARFGLRHQRQLRDDHRAMLESQLARLRERRNGQP
jgi:ABC-type Fe3+ transport system permease subunit